MNNFVITAGVYAIEMTGAAKAAAEHTASTC
ncbi:hypothetical protein J2T14_003214 [Paenibacillus harenae]|nr:hypothetical protein [Paenibacillus harenae]